MNIFEVVVKAKSIYKRNLIVAGMIGKEILDYEFLKDKYLILAEDDISARQKAVEIFQKQYNKKLVEFDDEIGIKIFYCEIIFIGSINE